jgi:hypothetical protein
MAAQSNQSQRLKAPFAALVRDGRRRTDLVDQALDEIALKYRGRSEDRSYRQLIEALRLVNQAARSRLERAEAGFARGPVEAYDNVGPFLAGFADSHERQVGALEPARHEALEVFAQPFTRMAKALLTNVEVLFFGWALESYELRVYDRERASDFEPGGAVSLGREFGEDFQFLQFWHPRARQPDLFQHAVFGHELGHPVIRLRPPDSVLSTLKSTTSTPTYANVAVEAANAARRGRGESDFTAYDSQRLARWLDELASDTIAMRLLGPAFAVAFVEVTAVNRDLERGDEAGLEVSKRYPPSKMRISVLARELKRFAFDPTVEIQLRPLLDSTIASTLTGTDPERELAGSTAWMDDALSAFTKYCIPAMLGELELDPYLLSNQLEDMWGLLTDGIPPTERITVTTAELPTNPKLLSPWSEPYDWRVVLNGVSLWLLVQVAKVDRQTGLSDAERLLARARSRGHATRLATGAIEVGEFHRRAHRLRDQYGHMRLPESWS